MDLTSYRESSKKVAEFLNKVPPVLLDSGTLVRVPAGQVVVRQEEPVKYAWFLLMGELLTFSETEDGKKSSFITLDAPSMLSDLELLADMPVYASNVMANTDCDMIRCDAAMVSRWLDNDLPFLRTVSALCNRKTYDSSYYRGKSAFRSSLDKVAIYLLRYCSLTPPTAARETVVTKTRQTMSSELIMSAKTVDRCLQQLQDGDYLSIVRGKVHITAAQYARLTENWGKTD